MLGRKRIEELAQSILAQSPADQTEVLVMAEDNALTRFANSAIHQNVAERDAAVRVRVVLGSRVGVASTNSLERDALARALETALGIARLGPENPHFHSLPAPEPIPAVEAFSERTAACTPVQRAKSVGAICMQARDAGLVASGALTTAASEIAVANSLGISAYHAATYADLNTVVMSDTSSGYARALAQDVEELDPEAIGREAVEKCTRSQNPRPLEPGEYAVVLEPYAVEDLAFMLSYPGFGAMALQEGRSFMTGKLGQPIVDPCISIWDDGLDPAGIPSPFDYEGAPKQRVDLIENGVARGVVYDSYHAGKEEGSVSTGHALPSPNSIGPLPLNTFFAPGDATLDEMVESTERGVYVTRFWYTRPVEPTQVVITGMTRDGTFLIEDGEIAYPVKNLRFTQSYLEALNSVEAVGRHTKLLPAAWSVARYRVPGLKLGRFNFTGATE
jgi:predicted Zn-dependent protease